MTTYSFRTNNIPRPLLTVDDLTAAETDDIAEVHLLDTGAMFFRYRGDVIPMADIMAAPNDLKAEGYDGYEPWSIGNGIAVRILDDGDSVVVAAYTNN